MDIANRKVICPFALKRTITAAIGELWSIIPNGRDKFLSETQNENQSNMINVQMRHSMRHCHRIIYLYEYDIRSIKSFEGGLRQKYLILNVKPATWQLRIPKVCLQILQQTNAMY